MEQNKNDIPQSDPIQKKEDVQNSNDERIDQDFPGYPNLPAKENIINPKTEKDAIIADSVEETITQPDPSRYDEIESDGSAGAFSSTEGFDEDEFDRLSEK